MEITKTLIDLPVRGVSLTIIGEGRDLSVWSWDSSICDGLTEGSVCVIEALEQGRIKQRNIRYLRSITSVFVDVVTDAEEKIRA